MFSEGVSYVRCKKHFDCILEKYLSNVRVYTYEEGSFITIGDPVCMCMKTFDGCEEIVCTSCKCKVSKWGRSTYKIDLPDYLNDLVLEELVNNDKYPLIIRNGEGHPNPNYYKKLITDNILVPISKKYDLEIDFESINIEYDSRPFDDYIIFRMTGDIKNKSKVILGEHAERYNVKGSIEGKFYIHNWDTTKKVELTRYSYVSIDYSNKYMNCHITIRGLVDEQNQGS